MSRLSSRIALLVGLPVVVLAIACSGRASSPLAPSAESSTSAGSRSTIRGTAAVGRSTSAAGTPVSLPGQVCVQGTTNCVNIDGQGKFELTGDFLGDVVLAFTSAGSTVFLTVPNVQAGETVVVKVSLNGSNGSLRVESRGNGGNNAADNESADDASDDESADDASDDESDDESADDESDDESADDDSEDDDSEDDDSEDDDSEDDVSDDDSNGGPGRG